MRLLKINENLVDETFNHFKEHLKQSVFFYNHFKIRNYAIKNSLLNDKNKEYYKQRYKKHYEKIKSLSFHGWNVDPWSRHKKSFTTSKQTTKHWKYEIENLGYKYNMNDYMAAMGLAQFKKLKKFNLRRREILKKYLEDFTKEIL